MIGYAPGLDKYGTNPETGDTDWDKTRNAKDIKQMTPNEYFDHIQEQGNNDELSSTAPRMINGKEYRWPGKGPAHIQDIIDGIKDGQVMGVPELSDGSESQEGGHRMEALRQMGHGDTKVPVAMEHGSNPDLDYDKYMSQFMDEDGNWLEE